MAPLLFYLLFLGIFGINCGTSEERTHETDFRPNDLYLNGDLRLVHPSLEDEGRLEMIWNGTWGTISGLFGSTEAIVACRQMGYVDGMDIFRRRIPGTGPIWLTDVQCSPHHTRLVDCPHDGIGGSWCEHSQDAYVACFDGPFGGNCSELRLVHPTGCKTEGRLEIFLNGAWGTICDDTFSNDNIGAKVACRRMGFANGEFVKKNVPGTGPIWLNSVHCSSSHLCLEDCINDGIGVSDCDHSEDAYIACYNGSSREPCPGD